MENKKFTKDDLKVGYVVKFRRGDLRMIMPGYCGQLLAIASDGSNGELDKYEDNLLHSYGLDNSRIHRDFKSLDIMEVYGFSCRDHTAYYISTEYRDLLWKREEKTCDSCAHKVVCTHVGMCEHYLEKNANE